MIFGDFILDPITFFLDGVAMLLKIYAMIPPVFGILLTLAFVCLLIRLLPL